MGNRISRILFILAALLLAGGGVVHAAAFRGALPAFAASRLLPFYANASKALWLSDATTLIAVGLFCLYLAVRPEAASRAAILLVALIPLATAILIYGFIGSFLPGHILIAASLLVAAGAFAKPSAAPAA
jgi:hypothetical protein